MKLTGKCKEDFKDWICITVAKCSKNLCTFENFYRLNDAAKYGVLVDFFDSVGLRIIIRNVGEPYSYWYVIHRKKGLKDKQGGDFISRPEVRTAAIQKANELHNNKN